MKKIELVGLGIRIFSIALFLMALTKLAAISLYFFEKNNSSETIISGIAFISLFILSVVLWVFPIIIAKKITPIVKEENIKTKWTIEELKETGLILLGLYLMYKVISDAAFWIIVALTGSSFTESGYIQWRPDDIVSIYVTVLEFFLSSFMIFGAKGIINFIKYVRLLGSK